MKHALLPDNTICQVGIVVRDIERTATEFCRVFGLPKPDVIITDKVDDAHTKYMGQPTEARSKLAFLQMGAQLQVELIEPIGGPSTWLNFLETHGEGVHHIAFFVKDMPAVTAGLAAAGMPTEQQGDYTGGRYAYISSAPALGVVLELLENFE
jgi:methylmalonyl-CoA/ethylmalonyl-CoA epimerase